MGYGTNDWTPLFKRVGELLYARVVAFCPVVRFVLFKLLTKLFWELREGLRGLLFAGECWFDLVSRRLIDPYESSRARLPFFFFPFFLMIFLAGIWMGVSLSSSVMQDGT